MALAQRRTQKVVPKDPAYRDQLITEYLPYVKRIVQRLAVHLPSTVDVDDLMNVGVIGLIQAVDRYDPRRDNKFMTYAIFRIKGAVLSELRARDFLSRSNRRKYGNSNPPILVWSKNMAVKPKILRLPKSWVLILSRSIGQNKCPVFPLLASKNWVCPLGMRKKSC